MIVNSINNKTALPGLNNYCSDTALLIAIPPPSITANITPPVHMEKGALETFNTSQKPLALKLLARIFKH